MVRNYKKQDREKLLEEWLDRCEKRFVELEAPGWIVRDETQTKRVFYGRAADLYARDRWYVRQTFSGEGSLGLFLTPGPDGTCLPRDRVYLPFRDAPYWRRETDADREGGTP